MIIEGKKIYADDIAKIHFQTLSDDFLPSLGINFLKSFYQGIIGQPGVYIFTEVQKNNVYGFVVGVKNSKKFFTLAIRSNPLKLSLFLLLAVIKNPFLIRNIFETILYPSKTKKPLGELVVIAVARKYQGKGIGKKLINSLEKKFVEKGITKYKLTVYSDKSAINFYEKLKFKLLSSFKLYGRMWFVYEKKIRFKDKQKSS